jgi:hypothetical protein
VLLHDVEHLGRAADERLAVLPVGAQVAEVVGREAALLAGEAQVQRVAVVLGVEAPQLVAEDRVVLGARRVDVHDVAQASWRAMLRSIDMIGVMPLPALMNSSFSGSGSGSVNVPSTPPRRTIIPGRASRTNQGETTPSSTSLGVIEMQPSGGRGPR